MIIITLSSFGVANVWFLIR